jgi:PKD repeat protein
MKKLLLSLFTMITLAVSSQAVAQVVTVSGHITSNTTWTNDKIYRLDGFVYVDSTITLTIQPGTIIRGIKSSKGSLIVTRGGKLIADGTKKLPIVFTSDEPAGIRTYGDWGGLIILGNAPINALGGQSVIEGGVNNANGDGQYGGPNASDNSGILRYVRIEYAGIPFSANNEINGLTMGGVGRGTIIDYVMVSFCGDDSFEWFGGTVNAKHLIAYKGVDDDFDTDFGYRGNVQFGLIIRDKDVADQAGDSNGFESDNDNTGTNQATPKTLPNFSNITLVGPKQDANTTINSKYNNALRIRRNSGCSAYNSIFMGFAFGLYVEGDSSANNATTNQLRFKNNIIAGCTTPLRKNTASFDIDAWYATTGFNNTTLANTVDAGLTAPYAAIPNCLPAANSPALTGADFTDSRLTNSFFTATTYKGAFGAEDWTEEWTSWDPQNNNYQTITPIANFSKSINRDRVQFTNTSQKASTYSWNFGDNSSPSTEVNPVHLYNALGNYTVTLSATTGGITTTKVDTIKITELPVNAQLQVISGRISSNTTWRSDKIYRLDGFVYVDSNATLTIESGTIIRGIKGTKGSLIVTRGGKLIAEGTKLRPIVFTSDEQAGNRTYGDWGGLIILGAAPINVLGGQSVIEGGVNNANGDGQYGGTNPNDNSGILKYVRIEYAGIPFSANNEINGLTLGGVGRGTVIENIMVSYCGDDAFEWFGGTVNAKNLIAYKTVDDDFDTDFGFQGNVQFGLIVRDKDVADQAGDSNGFESDNDNTGTNQARPKTIPNFSNITVVGPKQDAATSINSKYNNALRIRRNSANSAFNSIFMGFPTGLYIEGDSSANNATSNQLIFKNNIIAGCATPLKKNTASFDITAWFNTSGFGNSILTNNTDVQLTAAYAAVPNCVPAAGSPALTGASFSDARLANSFFTTTAYVGAFGADDWTQGWANWDPQNNNYSFIPTGINTQREISGLTVFPNPTNETATVKFELENTEKVNISIFNIQGMEIEKVLTNETLTQGTNQVQLNVSGLESGLYFVKVEKANATSTVRLSIVK